MKLQNSSLLDSFEELRYELDYDTLLQELGIEGNLYRGEIWCSCPLPDGNHSKGDRNPSFSINITDEKKIGLYNCFACGGGTIIELVQVLKNLSQEEALAWAKKFSPESSEYLEQKRFQNIIKAFLEKEENKQTEMPKYHSNELTPYRFIHPWMIKQGMTEEAIKFFQIGYNAETNSIFFPHYWKGVLVGWQERSLEPDAKPKYKSTPNFPKRNTLFNLDNVRGDSVIVVESPKTAVVLWGRGYQNVVATFGASVTPEQAVALWRFPKVYLWFDNDKAGRNAIRTTTKYMRDVVDLWVIPPVELDKGDPADIPAEEIPGYIERAIPSAIWSLNERT